MKRLLLICMTTAAITIAGCLNQAPGDPADSDLTPAMDASGAATAVVPTPPPTDTPAPTPTNTYPPPAVLSYLPKLFEDMDGYFILYYPNDWSEGFGEQQSRGYFRQLISWDRSLGTSIENQPEGGTYMQITMFLWEPTGDLDAYLAARHPGREGSGNTVLSQQELTVDGQRAVTFIVQSDFGGDPYFIFLMAVGDRYLEISGSGNFQLLAEISMTVQVMAGE